MNRFLILSVLSVGLTFSFTPIVSACINDSETVRTETEFKSNYNHKAAPGNNQPGYSPPGTKWYWQPMAAGGLGVGLIAATVVMVGVNIRRARRV